MNENYVIPNFQRNYVWKKEKIVSFLNSLLRNEPFGNIIIWNSDSITCDTRNSIIKKLSKTIDNDKKNKKYIIDGQQRLTTLFSLHNWNLINKHENVIEIKKFLKFFLRFF